MCHKGGARMPGGTAPRWFECSGGNGVQCLSQPTGEKGSLVGESGTVVPLLTEAASAPWRPSRSGAGCSREAVPNTAGLGSLRITSVVHSNPGQFAL